MVLLLILVIQPNLQSIERKIEREQTMDLIEIIDYYQNWPWSMFKRRRMEINFVPVHINEYLCPSSALDRCYMCEGKQSGEGRRPYFCKDCKQGLVDFTRNAFFKSIERYVRETAQMLEQYEKSLFPDRSPTYQFVVSEKKSEMQRFANVLDQWDVNNLNGNGQRKVERAI